MPLQHTRLGNSSASTQRHSSPGPSCLGKRQAGEQPPAAGHPLPQPGPPASGLAAPQQWYNRGRPAPRKRRQTARYSTRPCASYRAATEARRRCEAQATSSLQPGGPAQPAAAPADAQGQASSTISAPRNGLPLSEASTCSERPAAASPPRGSGDQPGCSFQQPQCGPDSSQTAHGQGLALVAQDSPGVSDRSTPDWLQKVGKGLEQGWREFDNLTAENEDLRRHNQVGLRQLDCTSGPDLTGVGPPVNHTVLGMLSACCPLEARTIEPIPIGMLPCRNWQRAEMQPGPGVTNWRCSWPQTKRGCELWPHKSRDWQRWNMWSAQVPAELLSWSLRIRTFSSGWSSAGRQLQHAKHMPMYDVCSSAPNAQLRSAVANLQVLQGRMQRHAACFDVCSRCVLSCVLCVL